QFVFLANGLLSYEQDSNGNRITLGYNAQNQLATLTYSNPADPSEPSEQLTLTCKQGLVSQVADGTGNTWTYTYDATGHLRSVTGPGNLTTSYSYRSFAATKEETGRVELWCGWRRGPGTEAGGCGCGGLRAGRLTAQREVATTPLSRLG